jgi:hypothetical protein
MNKEVGIAYFSLKVHVLFRNSDNGLFISTPPLIYPFPNGYFLLFVARIPIKFAT